MSLGRTTTRERSCDLVAFATLATLAAGPPLAPPVPFYIIGHDQSCLHRLCQVSPSLTAPRVFSRRARVSVQLFRCRRIASLQKEQLVKGSKWGSREVRNRAVNGKVEVLGKLMREGLDEKLDLWLEIGHFQIFSLEGFLPTKGRYTRAKVRRSSAHFVMHQ